MVFYFYLFTYKLETPEKDKDIEKIRFILEISYLNNVIYKAEFFDSIFIPNIIFKGIPVEIPQDEKRKNQKEKNNIKEQEKIDISPKENIPYSISCLIDSSEAPSWIKSDEVDWNIRVFSSDTLGFVKDTKKEESEKNIKDSWEINQPGRSNKAKYSRFLYIIKTKLEKNENLTSEEILFLQDFKNDKLKEETKKDINQENKLKNKKIYLSFQIKKFLLVLIIK